MPETIEKIKVPEGVAVDVREGVIKVKGKLGETQRAYPADKIAVKKEGGDVVLSVGSDRKKERAVLGTNVGHVRNMIKGVTDGVKYKLKIVYSHFPMTVKVQGDAILIENFLGEKYPRKTSIGKNVTVSVKGQEVEVKGVDLEAVSQTAANLEQTTRIVGFDPRVFQDGIYIVEKNGKAV